MALLTTFFLSMDGKLRLLNKYAPSLLNNIHVTLCKDRKLDAGMYIVKLGRGAEVSRGGPVY